MIREYFKFDHKLVVSYGRQPKDQSWYGWAGYITQQGSGFSLELGTYTFDMCLSRGGK